MTLIDRDLLKETLCDRCVDIAGLCQRGFCESTELIDSIPKVDAVPIEELIELRNKLYEDSITFRGLADLNQLIGKHVRRKEQG